jgi:hypothetical protein
MLYMNTFTNKCGLILGKVPFWQGFFFQGIYWKEFIWLIFKNLMREQTTCVLLDIYITFLKITGI